MESGEFGMRGSGKEERKMQTTLWILHGTRPAVWLVCVAPKSLQGSTQSIQCSVWMCVIYCRWLKKAIGIEHCHRHLFPLFIIFASLMSIRLVSQLIIFQLSYQISYRQTLHKISTHIKLSVLKFWAQVVVPPTTRITFNAMRSPKPVLRLTCLIWRGVKTLK